MQCLRLLPSRMVQNRMTSDTQAAPTRSLHHARCLFHPLREAAARCPHCGGTFCRECVTDEDDKLACPPCLRRMARPPAPTPVAAQSGSVAPVHRRGTQLNALEALERGFALFQSTFAQEGWLYYLGA